MHPQLALLLTIAFIFWLFRRDMSWRRLSSAALWIPGVWLGIISSQQVSYWLHALGLAGASSKLEGSPINVVFNFSLFLAAIVVLRHRNFSWGNFFLTNKALVLLFGFFLCSMLWSPIPMPTLKRVVQNFGCVITGLIILTEKDPAASLRVIFVRLSYILFPLSVIFIKYFPHIGRTVSYVSGTHMLSGVAGHKNSLGELAMVLCLVLLWDIMETRKHKTSPRTVLERWARLMSLGIGIYLLVLADSSTAWICFLLGVGLFFTSKRMARLKYARQVVMIGVLCIAGLLVVEQVFAISDVIFSAFGEDKTFTGRTDIWRLALEKNRHHLLGNGFGAFWYTREGESVWQEIGMNRLVTAHSGYLEAYLDGGIVALSLLIAMILSTGINAMNKLVYGDPIGRLAVLYWPIILINNVTESVFFIPGALWFAMLLVTIDDSWRKNGSVKGVHG